MTCEQQLQALAQCHRKHTRQVEASSRVLRLWSYLDHDLVVLTSVVYGSWSASLWKLQQHGASCVNRAQMKVRREEGFTS